MRSVRPVTLRAICLLLLALAPALLLSAGTRKVRADPRPRTDATERFGINVLGSITPYDVAQLHIHWYQNWGVQAHPSQPNGVEYVQVIRLREDPSNPDYDYWPPDWNRVADALTANPGALWLIGNEPDHRGQDNCLASEYAARYHECYTFIKDRDPSARVSPAGLVQVTPLRLHWLNDVLAAYRDAYGTDLPADVWNIHVQILCETCGWGATYPPGLQQYQQSEGRYYSSQDAANVDIFIQHVRDFRLWMRDHGYRDNPLILSEYGVLQPSGCGYLGGSDVAKGNQMVKDFMTGTFDYMLEAVDPELGYPEDDNRLVQRWAWYSLNARMSAPDCSYLTSANGSLYDWQDVTLLTEFGVHWKEYTDALLPPTETILVGHTTPQRYQAEGDPSWVVTLALFLDGPGQAETSVQTDAYGAFTTTVSASGTYTIGVKGSHTLENRLREVVLAEGTNQVDLGTLLEGDADNDNVVSILDYSLLYNTFDSVDPRTDFNQDGIVDSLDYSLLYTNFDEVGPRYLTETPASGLLTPLDAPLLLRVGGGTLTPGQTLTVPVYLSTGTQEVDAAQFRLRLDPTMLRAVDAAGQPATEINPGPLLSQVIRNRVDPVTGEVYFVAGVPFDQPPAQGEILLATLHVQAVGSVGQTVLQVEEAIVGRAGMPLPVTLEEGHVTVGRMLYLPLGYHAPEGDVP
jgi:hypothetical protein